MLRPEILVEYVGQADTPLDDRLGLFFRFGYLEGRKKYDLNVVFDLSVEDNDYAGVTQGILYQVNDVRQVELAPKQRNVYLYIERTDNSVENGFTTNIDNVFGTIGDVPQRYDDLFVDNLTDIYNQTLPYQLFRWFPDTNQWLNVPLIEAEFTNLRWRVYRHPNNLTLGLENAWNGVVFYNNTWRLISTRPGLRHVGPDELTETRVFSWDGFSWVVTDIDPFAPRGIELNTDFSFMSDHGLQTLDDWNMYPELLDGVLEFMTEEVISKISSAHAFKEGTETEEVDIQARRNELLRQERFENIVSRITALREARRALRPQFLGAFSRPVIRPRPVRRVSANLRSLGRRRFR